MARPTKQTVPYFPHTVDHGKTLFILEQRFGNDGYAFWFKLLEILGKTDGHYLNLNDDTQWEFLVAKTRLCDSSCTEILDLLSKLGAINTELWEKRFVWCQKFVDNISDVYKKRKRELPEKPIIDTGNHTSAVVSAPETPQNSSFCTQPVTETPQSKVKYSKVNKSKVKKEEGVIGEITNNRQPKTKLPDWLPENTWNDYVDMRKKIKSPMTEKAKELAIGRLQGFKNNGYNIVDIINNSIMNSWKGLFIGDNNGKDYRGSKQKPAEKEASNGQRYGEPDLIINV